MSNSIGISQAFDDSMNQDGTPRSSSLNNIQGSESIFNKFSVFRYHKFGPSKVLYNQKLHLDKSGKGHSMTAFKMDGDNLFPMSQDVINASLGEDTAWGTVTSNKVDKFPGVAIGAIETKGTQADSIIDNPTAKSIINWSREDNPVFGPTPYSYSDFLYCKHYGMIPNNRLVTLRRFPMPVKDNMRSSGGEKLVPLAQAVTWFGDKIGNPLKAILPHVNWGIPWTVRDAQDGAQDFVEMENVTLQEVVDLVTKTPGLEKIPGFSKMAAIIAKIAETVRSSAATSGADQSLVDVITGRYEVNREFNKNLYNSTGPRWNEIYGGVNWNTSTMIRDSFNKMTFWQTPIKIKFHYALKSFNGIKPKVAALDLISNFISLTYMNTQWKGSFSRFLPKAGVTGDIDIDATITRLFGEGKVVDALALSAYGLAMQMKTGTRIVKDTKAGSNSADNFNKAGAAISDVFKNVTDLSGGFNGIQLDKILDAVQISSEHYKKMVKNPVSMRAPLSGQPTGEWHLVIGNPMEPIAMVGNLICKSCSMELGEELGPDDFPTEITFTVELQCAMPRDKHDIESMFNLGGGSLTEISIVPSSARNTFGTGEDSFLTTSREAIGTGQQAALLGRITEGVNKSEGAGGALRSASKRIASAYGKTYSEMAMLPAYFMTNQITKDALKQNKSTK
jgi:hypothetical protein